MRTILLLGVAAGSLLLAGRAHSAERLDYRVPSAQDTRVYTGYPDRVPSEVDYRHVSGTYEAEGRWTGTWDGTYEAPDGRRYRGSYEGTVDARPGAGYAPPPPYDPYYDGPDYGRPDYSRTDSRHDEDMRRRCGSDGKVGGAVIGGVVGGVAGNRIAGRGNRTAGTLIGGGVGALAGAAIGNEADRKKCEQWRASRGAAYSGAPHSGGYYPGAAPAYPPAPGYPQGAYGYGYGYYTPGYVVTTIINGPPVVTETIETSTRTYYETVPVRKRIVAKKRVAPKPRPKPRCVC